MCVATRIVIIGGGPAGYEAALVAAARDAHVTVIDSDGIGGAAVLFDVVPSKAFIASTGVRTELRRGHQIVTLLPRRIQPRHRLIQIRPRTAHQPGRRHQLR